MYRRRTELLLLSAAVVFITTYLLILPALTLEADTAAGQGGIDMPAAAEETELAEETAATEEPAATEEQAAPEEQESADEAQSAAEAEPPEESAPASVSVPAAAEEEAHGTGGGTLTAVSERFTVTVDYKEDAGIPKGAGLEAEEIPRDSEEYAAYLAKTEDALGWKDSTAAYIRLFDIRIVDSNGNKVEVAAPVDVRIELADKAAETDAQVVHFADGAETGDVIEKVDIDGEAVSFEADGFSAYAIVEGPEAVEAGWHKVASVEELLSRGSEGLYIGHTSGYYFTDGITRINNTRTGITKTKPAQNYPPADRAVRYYFEKVPGTTDQFRVSCGSDDSRKYIVQSANSLNLTTDAEQATVFTIEPFGDEAYTFRAKGNDGYYWNMQGGANGASFAAYNNAEDPNAKMYFWYSDEVVSDPYDLNGKSYGLMNWNGGAAGKALMAEPGADGHLKAKALTVMSTQDNTSSLFVPNESDISMWTFHWLEGDQYYLSTVVDGSTKYLRIDADGLTLVSTPDNNCRIQAVPGTGIHAGEVYLKSGGNTLTYTGNADTGFSVGGSAGNEWLHFVKLSELTEDYFRTYSARKVSVSDPAVTNGSRVIVYTRSWNDEKKRYDYYAIGSDGTLVPVYESGDSIEWVSGQLNQLLWNFTEYYWEGTEDPNYYYELFNQYSEKYIAPQVTGGQILSDDAIGINMNGRKDGRYASPILAWDDAYYAYAGLKVEDGQVVSCPKSEAMDFYFAVMQDINVDDDLTTVPTVDHTQYGITMKMIDFDTRAEMSNFLGNDQGGLGRVLHQGLLSTDLTDGYPTATKEGGGSLRELFSGAEEVNHLFIQSTYDETGYFVFDSTQNYASLKGKTGGDFTVYKELGSYDSVGSRPTLKHGQFFPYNDLEPGVFASVNGKNLYGLSGSGNNVDQLPDSDPRKNENLYLIENGGKKVDCYFGMELEAIFTQTPSGLDAWGHDIIFEFTGDDDFWLYVDGELVIDLGGIHSAVPGSVNFRTGDVYVNGTHTTLRATFESNYRTRHPGASDADVANYLSQYFDEGSTVFRDYTNHTMNIFYMERGAGASNLQMRFNLAAVKKGNVQLSKELSGVDESEGVLAEFPYQIWYKTSEAEGAEEYRLPNLPPGSEEKPKDYVLYKDTINPVKYEDAVTIGGTEYKDVFFLKPGETADISFPESMTSYRIVECGVNTDVFGDVTVNGTTVDGTAEAGYQENRKDYAIDYATTDGRAKVNYVNAVVPDALRTLTISKQLFEEDGTTRIHYPDNDTAFIFRLRMATEYGELTDANMYTYHVKDADGNYCQWDAAQQKFVKIGGGITDYQALTDEQKEAASFTTSIYGTISKIPADHTVEIRNVLAGTRFSVQERPGEIPDGYSFQKYIYNGDVLPADAETGVADTVNTEQDPAVTVCNLKGWGLRMNKVWTDADYMSGRDPVYFAVFTEEAGELTLVEDTVYRLDYTADPQTLYWYFDHLPVAGTALNDYVIREVTVTAEGGQAPAVDDEGRVTNYTAVHPVPGGETVTLNGTQKGETEASGLTYTVSYETGQAEDGSNVRVDTVTNDRPGIILKKQDWEGNALAGAEFTLTDSSGDRIGTFTSDEQGLITVAFLSDEKDYILTETRTPQGYYCPGNPIGIAQGNGQITVTGLDSQYYTLTQAEGSAMATLTFRNRPWTLEAVKIDGDTNKKLQGVHFALHKQVTVDGVTNFDLNPMPGYEDLVTDENGVLPMIDNTLPAGVYQLREKQTPDGYQALPGYIEFTVTATGAVSLLPSMAGADWVTLSRTPEGAADATIENVLTIRNYIDASLRLTKTDEAGNDLTGATFRLCKYGTSWEEVSGYGEIDLTETASGTLEHLSAGRYRLEETKTPDGYVILTKYTYFNIAQDGTVTLTDENGTGDNANAYAGVDQAGGLPRITIQNTPGQALPNTGGAGATVLYVLGAVLIALSGTGLAAVRRRKQS